MRTKRSLKNRIALTYTLLAVTVAGAFSLVSYVSMKLIERQVIDARLVKVADTLIALQNQGHMPDAPPELRVLIDADIPASLRQLPAGAHELMLDDRWVRVLLRDDGTSRYAVIQQVDDLEHTERVILLSLAVGFVVSILLAAVLGLLSARRIIAPVAALADAVERNASAAELPSLADAVERNASAAELPSLSAPDEIGFLARAFAKRTDQLQQFLRRERLFTGDVSHELRTPLTVMLGAAEVLIAQLPDRPAQLATAERIRRVAAETAQRVSALLLLARAPESLDALRIVLNTIVEAEMERCRPLLAGKTVQCRLDCTEQVVVHVRPELAGMVIGNLLRNACQNTDQGMVLVQLAAGRLVVEDTGVGIPQAVRERLFERFVHGGGDRPGHESTGLGLSIVKRVVDHIGWDVHLEVPDAGGTRFVLTFPPVPTSCPEQKQARA